MVNPEAQVSTSIHRRSRTGSIDRNQAMPRVRKAAKRRAVSEPDDIDPNQAL